MQDVHAPGLVSMTCCSIEAEAPVRISPATVSTCSTYLVLSVLPAPDSPEMRMHWFLRFAMSSLKALVVRDFSNESKREGKSTKLVSMANIKVMDTNIPKATIPPKLDALNMMKPKKRMMEV